MTTSRTPRLYPLVAAAAVTAALCGTPAGAEAATWRYSQGGFDDGATVTGSFSGEDTDHDGWLLGWEYDNFSFTFSGNHLFPAFTSSFGNGGGFSNLAYRIGSDTIDHVPYGGFSLLAFAEEGDDWRLIRYASYDWEAANSPGMLIDFFSGVTSSTTQALTVTPVPEPSTNALLLLGLGVVGTLARRRLGARG